MMGFNQFNVSASATAVHRPRDVAIVIDLSGSMRFSSLLGIPYSGSRSTNNPEAVYPQFGHYSSSSANLRQSQSVSTISGYTYYATNTTDSDSLNLNRPAIVGDFFDGVSSTNPAFTSAGNGDSEGFVSGDKFLRKSGNSGAQNYAVTFQDVNNGSTSKNTTIASNFESYGYDYSSLNTGGFQGYTQGPGFWGKTFFVWPPDPRRRDQHLDRESAQQRGQGLAQRFFLQSDGSTPITDNTALWDSSGDWNSPRSGWSTNYKINYRAILYWLQNTGPNPFPSQLQAGRILYYSQIPDPTDTGLNTRMWNEYPVSDPDERFWKEFIDYVLGVCQNSSNGWMTVSSRQPNIIAYTGYGDDFGWGTQRISRSLPASSWITATTPTDRKPISGSGR